MTWRMLLDGSIGFLTSCLIGSLAEYLVHVLMHRRLLQGKLHTFHHKDGTGQGVWGEFLAYLFPAFPFIALLGTGTYFLIGLPYVVGLVAGYVFMCFFCAYCHQASHERPELMFWMKQPPHHVHHRDNMWWHNYGVSTTVWDHLFRTHKVVEYTPPKRMWQLRPWDFFKLKWF